MSSTDPAASPSAPGALDRYLVELCTRRASDLLLTAGVPPLLRIDGELVKIACPPLTPADTERLVAEVLGPEQFAKFALDKELDLSISRPGLARFRANAFHQRGVAAMALRLIPLRVPTLAELGVPPILERFVQLPYGLVLVTGPTGSGKSTTLASMVDAVNAARACHIITIEDPIEYLHAHKRAAVNQREVGVDTYSFERGLRSALREDPDVLLLGEMRDAETIGAALTIAETGHLVFASLHTNDAAQSIDRILDVFPGDQQHQIRAQLAESLQAVISQRLVPRAGGGRIAAFEVMVANSAVRNLIREGRTNQLRNSISTGSSEGMQTLESSMAQLVTAGVITYEAALAHTMQPNELQAAVAASH